jgi:micrococcal nuclease
MRRIALRAPLLVALVVGIASAAPARAQDGGWGCDNYASQAAAQGELDLDPSDPYGLDPDGNGIACDDQPLDGAPGDEDGDRYQETELPASTVEATVSEHIDGDKIYVEIDGNRQEVRLLGIDAPEGDIGRYGECYAEEASDHVRDLLPEGATVYLERDRTDRDGSGRLYRFLWFETDDGDYRMLNEMMLRDGFAGSATDHSYTKHDDTLSDAANAARDEAAGLWGECGGLHAEITPTPVVPTPTPTFEEIVTQYPPIPDIRELAIRPGSLFGERISFSGTILTIQVAIPGNVFILGDSNPAGYGTAIQVTVPAPDGSTEVIFVGYDGDTTGMFEGTWVTIFGTVVDTQSGENLLGGSITQPLVAAELVLIG